MVVQISLFIIIIQLSNGLFYCLSHTGCLRVFDPIEYTWSVLVVPPPKCLLESSTAKNSAKESFMIDHKGNIFVIHICCEVRTLDGVTLFASFLSSHSRTYVTGIMRNSVYFPKAHFYGKRCISFSLDDHRYYPTKQCLDL
ncbi:transcription regulation protein, putative [Medicago truncatula]|uniref:Transcription regulation protein, putative n=1 Tax=Medicago truncatula TaxID=3880 RepID=G7KQW2_MEDTR|nr:transcription regulation protein, putative [Medicago truncatula]